jgi:hypothetical protein
MKYEDCEISTFETPNGWGGFARLGDWTVRLKPDMLGPEIVELELQYWVDIMYENYEEPVINGNSK